MSKSPLTNFHFSVELGGGRIGFTEVSGLNFEHEIIEYREGNNKTYAPSKVPGIRKYNNVVLKSGLYHGEKEFFDWWNDVNFESVKRTVTIKQLNEAHEPNVIWTLQDAWPVAIKYSNLHAIKTKILIERLELAYEFLSMQNE